MSKGIRTFEYLLEEERQKFLTAASLITEFETTFRDRAEAAESMGKDRFLITSTEYECTAKLFRSIHQDLLTAYSNLSGVIKQQEIQNALLELALQQEILSSNKQQSAAA